MIMQEISDAGLASWDAAPFLEKVTQTAPGIIYVYNQRTQSNEYSNRSLGVSLGYSAEEIQSMGSAFMPKLCHPDDFPRMIDYFQDLHHLRDGEVSRFEYRIRHKENSWVWLESHDTIFERDKDGNVLRHIGVANNITLQKQAEATAIAERQAAELANEELRTFAYSVSHDMKSPSNTLALLLNELREDHLPSLDDDARNLVDLSLQTVARMQNLIEEVLGYTRTVGQSPQFEPVLLSDLMDKVQHDLQAEITAAGATLSIESLPTVQGSEPMLRTLFQNLITNAIKFCSPGRAPSILIFDNATQKTADGARTALRPAEGRVTIAVQDNGIGLPPDCEERIFCMFGRLHTADQYPGTGLGLSLCHRIATNHGGQLTYHSAPGEGATFMVELPLA